MKVKLYHIPAGIVMGIDGGVRNVAQRMCHVVGSPVMLTITGNSVSMMPFFTMSRSSEYLVPKDTLTFCEPMEPNETLEENYLKVYVSKDPEGLELSTNPGVLQD